MKTIRILTVAILPLAAYAHDYMKADQIPLNEDNIIRPNGSVAVSSEATSNNDTVLDNASSANLKFASDFLAKSKAPPKSSITSFKWAGPGCPDPTSLYADFNTKSGALSYFTPRFSLVAGQPDAMPADSRKQCTVVFEISYPKGWQYSLGGAESKGYVGFAAGGGALVEGAYWFAGVQGIERWSSRLQGPLHEEWMLGYKPNDDQGRWSQCGGRDVLSVQMSVYLPPSATDPGVFLLEWTNVYLRWQACDGDEGTAKEKETTKGPEEVEEHEDLK